MPNYNQRQPVDYANIYFSFIVWRAIGRVAGKILSGLLIVFLLIATQCLPDYSTQIILGTVGALVGFVVLCGLWVVISVLNRIFWPPTARKRAIALDRKLGWVSNPEPGVSWFRENGEKKQYDHATGTWS